MPRVTGALLAFLLAPIAGRAAGSEFQLSVSAHGLYSHLGEDVGAAADLVLAGAWRPLPELALGLEAALTLPLHTGDDPRRTDMALRANPALWLIHGDEEAWGYLKAGAGLDSHLRRGRLEPVLVLLGAAGFVVAPPELAVFFGFEIFGALDLAGDLPNRSLGLGGVLGWRF